MAAHSDVGAEKIATGHDENIEHDTVVKAHHQHAPEHLEELAHVRTEIDVIELTTESPYLEANFIGTMAAIIFGACASFAQSVLPITSLALINAQVGPSPNITWIALAHTLTLSVAYTLVGRLSDIFGRRYFFAGCSALGLIGAIIGSTANSVDQLIVGQIVAGLGSSGQISFNYVTGELVPVRHRFVVGGVIFACTFPFSGLGAYIGRLFIARSAVGWRGIYYLCIALNGASTACWLIWYHPPKFERLHKNRSKMDELRDLDYGGIFLFTAGLVLFLMGLSWGGQLYAWNSAYVIGTLVVGGALLVLFVLYEIYMPVRRPIIPMHHFKNWNFNIITLVSAVGGMIFYSMNVIFPTMVSTLFTTDVVLVGLITSGIGCGVCVGELFGALGAVPGGNLRWKLVFISVAMTAFIGALAGAGDSQSTAIALATIGGFMVGATEIYAATIVTIVIDDQSEMGTAAGVFGSIRSIGGVIATAIYVAILQNKVASSEANDVAPALVQAGLPVKSVAALLAALASGNTAAIQAVPGVTSAIIAVAVAGIRNAYKDAFKIIFLVSVAFGVVSIIFAWAFRDIEGKLSHDIIRRLDRKQTEDAETGLEKVHAERVE